MDQALDEDIQRFKNQNIRVRHIGRSDRLSKNSQEKIQKAENFTNAFSDPKSLKDIECVLHLAGKSQTNQKILSKSENEYH